MEPLQVSCPTYTLSCRGEGAASDQGVAEEVDICVGTLSKAFGCHGGFVALSAASKQLLLNRGRSYVYSTALPVPIVAGALAALRVATVQVCVHSSQRLVFVGWGCWASTGHGGQQQGPSAARD